MDSITYRRLLHVLPSVPNVVPVLQSIEVIQICVVIVVSPIISILTDQRGYSVGKPSIVSVTNSESYDGGAHILEFLTSSNMGIVTPCEAMDYWYNNLWDTWSSILKRILSNKIQ